VRALPKRQSQAIALHYLEDLPVAEIAEILECAESTVKVHLHKGRKRLADRLDLDLGEAS
jgi:RNA polymerase sigma-70 factor (ECF subfamily)